LARTGRPISRLRRKLNVDGDSAYVINVWGVGYRLVATAG
jgi:DNA-binding response OmpR family regulator